MSVDLENEEICRTDLNVKILLVHVYLLLTSRVVFDMLNEALLKVRIPQSNLSPCSVITRQIRFHAISIAIF